MPKKKMAKAIATAIVATGAVALVPVAANAGQSDSTPKKAEATGHGLKNFQAAHDLKETGKIDKATGKALQKAPQRELLRVFETPDDLPPAQRANADTVIGVGKGANIPEQGQVIALMTAMQESKFVNYTTPVDHDSLGIFQQRPSTGWGTPEQITDVPTSTKSFYGVADFGNNPGLLQIDGWENMPPNDACQAVQKSGVPDAYAKWEGFARDLLAKDGPGTKPIP